MRIGVARVLSGHHWLENGFSGAEPGLGQGEDLTWLGHAFQGVPPAIDECEAGAADEVAHRARNEDLARRREAARDAALEERAP
jgi:hypothetical protein